MRYKLLGPSGLRVSELCLGTMTFGEGWGWGASPADCRAMWDCFAAAGGNFVDSSVNYTDGESETILGDLLQADRDYFVVATKYTLTRPDSLNPNSGGNSRKSMMQAVERSLRRLRTDYIDLFYLHMWDYLTPVAEVMRGLDDLVRAGKVLYVAVSDTPAHIVAEANTLAELRGWSRFVGLQVPYSLLDRAVERALLPTARHWGMTVLPWGILEAGILTGKFGRPVTGPTRVDADRLKLSDRAQSVLQAVHEVAEATGRSMAQVAVNWVRQQQHQVSIVPLLGARNVAQLQDNLGVLEWSLSPAHLARLDEASRIDLGFPHGFLEGNPHIYGATYEQLDDRRIRREQGSKRPD